MFTQTTNSHRDEVGIVGTLQPKQQDEKIMLSALTGKTNNINIKGYRCPIGVITANMIADTLVSVHDYSR